ncbi:hypothetical protein BDW72DRAFT_44161 [Aspergillus terricola var. indicus]
MQTWCVRLSCGGVALITAVITDLPLIILTLAYPFRSRQGKWQAAHDARPCISVFFI